MKKRAMMAKKKGQSSTTVAENDQAIPLETDDLVSFSEERYDNDKGVAMIPITEQWSDDDDEWDEEWNDEEIDEEKGDEQEEESDEEILDFLKKKFLMGKKQI